MAAPHRPIRNPPRTQPRSARAAPPRGNEPAEILSRAVGRLLSTLDATASNPRTHPDTLVHEVRLATKTLRAYVRLLETGGAGPPLHALSDRLRLIALELGGARDAVVVRRTLRSLARRPSDLPLAARERGLASVPPDPAPPRPLTRPALQRLTRALDHAGHALQRQIRQTKTPHPFAQALGRHYTALRARSKRLRQQPDPDAWHRWRKRTKAFHYQLAWLGRALPARLRRLARRCWKLQRDLGDHHDLVLVHTYLSRTEPRPRDRDGHRRLLESCRAAMRRIEQRVGRRSRRVTRLKPRCFKKLVKGALAATAHP